MWHSVVQMSYVSDVGTLVCKIMSYFIDVDTLLCKCLAFLTWTVHTVVQMSRFSDVDNAHCCANVSLF